MANVQQPQGTVLEGNFKGGYIYYDAGKRVFYITRSIRYSGARGFLGNISEIKRGMNDLKQGKDYIPSDVMKVISKETVERYEDIGSYNNSVPNMNAAIRGYTTLGAFGGMLGAMAGMKSDYDIAVYFTNGDKSLIRLNSTGAYQELKTILFDF